MQLWHGYPKSRYQYDILVRKCILKLDVLKNFKAIFAIFYQFLRTFLALTPFLLVWDPKYYTYSENLGKNLQLDIEKT